MPHRNLEMVSAEGSAQRRRGITLNQHDVRTRTTENGREALKRAGKHVGGRLADVHDSQVEFRTNAKRDQGSATEVLVLSSVDDGDPEIASAPAGHQYDRG